MRTRKWAIIAQNEYRIRTSFMRKRRPHFPYIAGALLALYVIFIAPKLVSLFINDFLAFVVSQAAVALVQILLVLFFFYFAVAPIISALREETIEQVHIFLKAPVRASDVLLGRFLGTIPVYAIFITLITGLFTALLHPLKLTIVQTGIIILIFVIIFLSAIWIGTVLAAVLKTRLGKTARGRDIGRGLAMIIALPMVAMYYVLAYGGLLEALADPGTSGMVKTLLGWLPTSWGAEIIVEFASNQGIIGAGALVRFLGLLLFFGVSMVLGSRAADRAYNLELTTFISSQVNPDGIFYKTITYLSGGQSRSFSTLVVSLFKDYSRRLENLSGITYVLAILLLMVVFIAPRQSAGPDEPPVALLFTMFMYPIVVAMVTGEVTVRGKQSLYLYRKAPSGEERFIKAMLVKSWLMAVPIAGAVTLAFTWFTMQVTFGSLLLITGLMMLFIAAYVVFVLGLFLLNPAFSDRSVKMWINVVIAMFTSIGFLAVSLYILTRGGRVTTPTGGILFIQVIHTTLSWIAGVAALYGGKRNLRRIE